MHILRLTELCLSRNKKSNQTKSVENIDWKDTLDFTNTRRQKWDLLYQLLFYCLKDVTLPLCSLS